MDLDIVNNLLKDYDWAGDTADTRYGKIYKITNTGSDAVYIGSTCQTLEERFLQHLYHYRQWIKSRKNKNTKYKGMTSYKVFKDGFSKITLIEDYPCDSIRELRKRVGEVIRDYPTAVNLKIAGRTSKQWEAERKQAEIDAAKERSIPKQEGYEETSVQDMMKDLQMMSAF